MKVPIFSHTAKSYAKKISGILSKGEQHAKLIYKEWFQKGVVTGEDPAFNNAKKLYQEILELTDFSYPVVIKKLDESKTGKFLTQTKDQFTIESVILPMKAGWTLCISSQVGCRMGCAFCETGKMGLLRNLQADEIVSQLFQARHHFGVNIRNLVFMGMGEPLDNYEEVMQAINIFTDPHGFNLGPRHITISTSGCVDHIYRFMHEANPALNLAVSINAPNDEIRNRLMPVNKTHDMGALKKAMEEYCKHPKRKIFIEYVMIDGKNDSLESAKQLAEYLRGLHVTINLIPCNPQSKGPFKASSLTQIEAFASYLKKEGYLTFTRVTKGQKIMAACGQLGTKNQPQKLSKDVSLN